MLKKQLSVTKPSVLLYRRRPKDEWFGWIDHGEQMKPTWEPYYAKWPRQVHGKWYWLTTIYRKVKVVYGDRKFEPVEYTYGDVFDKLKEDNES